MPYLLLLFVYNILLTSIQNETCNFYLSTVFLNINQLHILGTYNVYM